MKPMFRSLTRAVMIGLTCLSLAGPIAWGQESTRPSDQSQPTYMRIVPKTSTYTWLAAGGMLVATLVVAFIRPKRCASH
ncbi:MAG: hypothetical protein JSU68_10425 [Phycisphaerales bacterium]|nr:MAG: hypothetical protein JSU68_10425 [Phycisphaerales bacterium]